LDACSQTAAQNVVHLICFEELLTQTASAHRDVCCFLLSNAIADLNVHILEIVSILLVVEMSLANDVHHSVKVVPIRHR
jgi:hypothetical protein